MLRHVAVDYTLLAKVVVHRAFVSLVDFSIAFDYVNYWKLFNQPLDDGVGGNLVELLAYWYCNQEL